MKHFKAKLENKHKKKRVKQSHWKLRLRKKPTYTTERWHAVGRAINRTVYECEILRISVFSTGKHYIFSSLERSYKGSSFIQSCN